MPDHVHLLVSIPPKLSVASFMGYLKGKSALMMFDQHTNLKSFIINILSPKTIVPNLSQVKGSLFWKPIQKNGFIIPSD
ncbi:Transposase IS200 like protein [Lentilactobacillus parabuchneri]|nr:Transposase IS200 like protein [Lentilactobacillus parabuchneri]